MWTVWFSEAVKITVLKSVTMKRLLKTVKILCVCSCSDIRSVWFSETVMITVLNSDTRKRLLKTEKILCAAVTAICGVCGSVGLL
jgi:hypothetical protein